MPSVPGAGSVSDAMCAYRHEQSATVIRKMIGCEYNVTIEDYSLRDKFCRSDLWPLTGVLVTVRGQSPLLQLSCFDAILNNHNMTRASPLG